MPNPPIVLTVPSSYLQRNVTWVPSIPDAGCPITSSNVTCTLQDLNPPAKSETVIVAPPATSVIVTFANKTMSYNCTVAVSSGVGTGPASDPSDLFSVETPLGF